MFVGVPFSSSSIRRVFGKMRKFRKRLRTGRQHWGGWKFDPNTLSLCHENPSYEIDLLRCRKLTAVSDWLIHLREKAWMTSEILGDLTAAFCDLLLLGKGDIEDMRAHLERLMREPD